MPRPRRAPHVALATLLRTRFPDSGDPEALIAEGAVLVDGVPARNPRARVRSDAVLHLRPPAVLRGTRKLGRALRALGVDVSGLVAVDLGAAAGGFTRALLDAGATTVYAVDAGVGQLRGSLRADHRVVNLERTNLADLDRRRIPGPVDLVTMDLSYLSVADAVPQLDRVALAVDAQLLALVKPTFELHAGSLAARPEHVAEARGVAEGALRREGWTVIGHWRCDVPGGRGAAEVFVHARRGAGAARPVVSRPWPGSG